MDLTYLEMRPFCLWLPQAFYL